MVDASMYVDYVYLTVEERDRILQTGNEYLFEQISVAPEREPYPQLPQDVKVELMCAVNERRYRPNAIGYYEAMHDFYNLSLQER